MHGSIPIASPASVLILLGTAAALAALPLLLRLVRPNRYYGIRVKAAFSSEQAWYDINAFGAKRLLVFAATVAVLGFALNAYPQAPFWLPIACLVSALFVLLATVRSIKQYADSWPHRSDRAGGRAGERS